MQSSLILSVLIAFAFLALSFADSFDDQFEEMRARHDQQIKEMQDRRRGAAYWQKEDSAKPVQSRFLVHNQVEHRFVEESSPAPVESEEDETPYREFFSSLEHAFVKDVMAKQAGQSLPPTQNPDDEKLRRLMEQMNEKIRHLEREVNEMPPALKELLFGPGNVTYPKEMDKEVACVSACEPKRVGNAKFEVYGCMELEESLECVVKCRPGVFADYVYKVVNTVHSKECEGHLHSTFDLQKLNNEVGIKSMECANHILSDLKTTVSVFQTMFGCYAELLNAQTPKEACYGLKYCMLDATLAKVESICKDDDMIDLLKFASVYSATVATRNGNLIRGCPVLYSLD